MNAPFSPPNPADPFVVATASVNAWRGRCIDKLALAETSVSEALLRLQSSTDGKFPHLVGQRFQILAGLLADREGAQAALAAVERVQYHSVLRTMLCHGKATVTLDRAGRWHAIFRAIRFEAGKAIHDIHVVDEREAETLVRELATDCQRLVGHLQAYPSTS